MSDQGQERPAVQRQMVFAEGREIESEQGLIEHSAR